MRSQHFRFLFDVGGNKSTVRLCLVLFILQFLSASVLFFAIGPCYWFSGAAVNGARRPYHEWQDLFYSFILLFFFIYYSVLKDFTEVFGRGSWLRSLWYLEVLDGYGYLLLAVRGEGVEEKENWEKTS